MDMEPRLGDTAASACGDLVSTRQARIAELARQHAGEPLNNLHRFMDLAWLQAAYYRVRKEGAPGIDGETWASYGAKLEANLSSLLERVHQEGYRAPPVRRVHIPKGDGRETRPIGIPTLEDRVLQMAVKMLLEPILEQEFQDSSYGFRPGRSAHQALARIRRGLEDEGASWVVEVDIRKFFDTLDHTILRELVSRRVTDGVVKRLIGKWLKAGAMEDGIRHESEQGTPQGGVISPLLANLYLHEVLDEWLLKVVPPYLKGRIFLVRYADDFVIGCELKEDAEMLMKVLPKRFAKHGLSVHPEKSRLVDFGRPVTREGTNRNGTHPQSFDFLGFTHYWTLNRRGSWELGRKTASGRMTRALKKMSEWMREWRHRPIREQHAKLCAKVKGHHAYYGIAGNFRALKNFSYEVLKRWRYWLDRRGNKATLTWARFYEMVNRYLPLPKARIIHAGV